MYLKLFFVKFLLQQHKFFLNNKKKNHLTLNRYNKNLFLVCDANTVYKFNNLVFLLNQYTRVFLICDNVKLLITDNFILKDITNIDIMSLDHDNLKNCLVICLSTRQNLNTYLKLFKYINLNIKVPIISLVDYNKSVSSLISYNLNWFNSNSLFVVSFYYKVILYLLKNR